MQAMRLVVGGGYDVRAMICLHTCMTRSQYCRPCFRAVKDTSAMAYALRSAQKPSALGCQDVRGLSGFSCPYLL